VAEKPTTPAKPKRARAAKAKTEKFNILNLWTGEVQFTAELTCSPDTLPSIKLGLAVRAAVKARANLAGAYLAGADLAGAYLAGANLAGAYLAGADLARAYLAGAKWTDGIVIQKRPIQIYGLAYPITILDAHAQIGCQLKTLAEWEALDLPAAKSLDGREAAEMFECCRDALLSLAKAAGRSFDPPAAPAQVEAEAAA